MRPFVFCFVPISPWRHHNATIAKIYLYDTQIDRKSPPKRWFSAQKYGLWLFCPAKARCVIDNEIL